MRSVPARCKHPASMGHRSPAHLFPLLPWLLSPAVQGGCSARGYRRCEHSPRRQQGYGSPGSGSLSFAELITTGDQLQGAMVIVHIFPSLIKKKREEILLFWVKINKEKQKPKSVKVIFPLAVNHNYSSEPSGVKDHHTNEGCLC